MTELGHTVLTMDHPGTGTNPLPDQHPFLMPRDAADYEGHAFERFARQIDAIDQQWIGVGHSMGGMLDYPQPGPAWAFCGHLPVWVKRRWFGLGTG